MVPLKKLFRYCSLSEVLLSSFSREIEIMWIKSKWFSFLIQHRAICFNSAVFIFNSIGCYGISGIADPGHLWFWFTPISTSLYFANHKKTCRACDACEQWSCCDVLLLLPSRIVPGQLDISCPYMVSRLWPLPASRAILLSSSEDGN